ncbi:MAG: macro domain-containing protein [Lachnospiraceae bacterium]|nr:macro domain-containing protein [Lachnospiraceae bacterium]
MPFRIIKDDITKVEADAIVNTANPHVAVGDGVDSAIYAAAGWEQLLEERAKIGELNPGEVGVTPAFNLKAKYIIHVSGPRWKGGRHDEINILKACYSNVLQIAREKNFKSVAFPLIATGTYGFPKELGLQIAVDSFTDFLEDSEMEITLVVYDKAKVKVTGDLVDRVSDYVERNTSLNNDLYRDEIKSAAPVERRFLGNLPFGCRTADKCCMDKSVESDQDVSEDEMFEASVMKDFVTDKTAKSESPRIFKERQENTDSLDDKLKEIYTDSFEKHLQKMINKKGLKNSEVYAAANISKQYFSKLLKGQVKPSKEKMLALAVGLRLNIDETADFLKIAGYALSPISQTDAVVEYFIQNKDYNVIKIDIVLFDYGLEPLTNINLM